jgi:hypothetical protein
MRSRVRSRKWVSSGCDGWRLFQTPTGGNFASSRALFDKNEHKRALQVGTASPVSQRQARAPA